MIKRHRKGETHPHPNKVVIAKDPEIKGLNTEIERIPEEEDAITVLPPPLRQAHKDRIQDKKTKNIMPNQSTQEGKKFLTIVLALLTTIKKTIKLSKAFLNKPTITPRIEACNLTF